MQASIQDEAKKEGLMELIKKMYEMMGKDPESEGMMESEDAEAPEMDGMEQMMGGKKEDSLMSKAMTKNEGDSSPGDDLDMDEIKDFLTKRKKSPISKSINIMAVTKAPKKFESPKMKKY